jgi:hypothetical protein
MHGRVPWSVLNKAPDARSATRLAIPKSILVRTTLRLSEFVELAVLDIFHPQSRFAFGGVKGWSLQATVVPTTGKTQSGLSLAAVLIFHCLVS